MRIEGSYGFMDCFLVHCLLCGQHHRGINHYCEECIAERPEEVERDAKIRSYSGRWTIVSGCTNDDKKEES